MRVAIVSLCLVSMLATGCVQIRPWRVRERPWTPEIVAGASGVRVTQNNGATIVLEHAYLDADGSELHGTQVSATDEGLVAIPTDQLTLLETCGVEPLRVLANVGLGVLYAFAVLVVIIALNPPVGVYG